jgi:single-strand selective monofunctional uracil DNA glycosylase
MSIERAINSLNRRLGKLSFADPVTHIYNPFEYAKKPYLDYLSRYGSGKKKVLFLGMNPGPWGMAQTGVPFGDVPSVRDFLGISQPVEKPALEHEKRPILGFDCARVEVSGTRLWGAIAEHYGTPDRFFERCFIANYCPLVFMEQSGRNRTPDKLPVAEREPLFVACDEYLKKTVQMMEPSLIVGIGAFAEARAKAALEDVSGLTFGRILHPSPASPLANRGWAETAKKQVIELGICGDGGCC